LLTIIFKWINKTRMQWWNNIIKLQRPVVQNLDSVHTSANKSLSNGRVNKFNRVLKWWHHYQFFVFFFVFFVFFLRFLKLKKIDKNRAKICWDMSSWTKTYLHPFIVILRSVPREHKIIENVWQYLYIQQLISRIWSIFIKVSP